MKIYTGIKPDISATCLAALFASRLREPHYVTRADLIAGSPAWRVPADDIEQLVCERVAKLLGDQHFLCDLAGEVPAEVIKQLFASADTTAATIRRGTAHARSELLMALIDRIALRVDGIDLVIDKAKLAATLGFVRQNDVFAEPMVLDLPAARVRRGHQLRLVIPGPETVKSERSTEPARRDDKLIGLLAEAQDAQQLVLAHPGQSLAAIATGLRRCRKKLGKLLAVSCLAPDIVTAVIAGKQPSTLSARTLLEVELPMHWNEQREMLGFA